MPSDIQALFRCVAAFQSDVCKCDKIVSNTRVREPNSSMAHAGIVRRYMPIHLVFAMDQIAQENHFKVRLAANDVPARGSQFQCFTTLHATSVAAK